MKNWKYSESFIRNLFLKPAALLVLFSCCHFQISAQQTPMYSQYMFNMLNINPAYAGNRAVNNITALYRDQWVGFEGRPVTAVISWDRRQSESNVGYGLQLYDDRLGIESTTGLQGFYSYRIPFDQNVLTFGLSLGLLNFKAAYTETTIIDAGDPAFAQNESVWLPTAGFGMLVAGEKWYGGFSIPGLLKTKSFYNDRERTALTQGANYHYFLTGGYVFEMSDAIKLKPSLLFKAVAGAPLQVDVNLNSWWNDCVGLGISCRTGEAVVGLVELQVNPHIRLGYAYDYTISKLNQFNQGSHELMLRYEFELDKVVEIFSPRYY